MRGPHGCQLWGEGVHGATEAEHAPNQVGGGWGLKSMLISMK